MFGKLQCIPWYIWMLQLLFAIWIGHVGCQDGQEIACDINAANTCPYDYCCVRDEFLFTLTYCKPHGKAGATCTTRSTQFECPCESGLQCRTNIHGHIDSVYGTCHPDNAGNTSTGSP